MTEEITAESNEDRLIELVRDLIDRGVITVDSIKDNMSDDAWKIFNNLCDLLHKR